MNTFGSKVALGVAVSVLSTGLLALAGCTACPPTDSRCNAGVGGSGGHGGSGGSGGSGVDLYNRVVLDPKPSDRYFLDIAVTGNKVGVAYVAGQGEYAIIYNGDAGITADGGAVAVNYDIRYVEWNDGTIGTPEVVDTVQRMAGISVAISPTTSQPAIGYLGGGSDMSLFWFNSDAELSVRGAGGTWTKEAVATTGVQVMCGNPVSDVPVGVIVGVWPAIAYKASGELWYCYRDVHTGQYPLGDWAGSDVECVSGTPSPPASTWNRFCTRSGGNGKDAPGGRTRMLMVNDEPIIIWDQVFGGADSSGQNVWVQQHTPGCTAALNCWTNPQPITSIAATQSGATMGWDDTEGLGVAVVDQTQNILFYVRRQPGRSAWDFPDQVFGEGSGGWYSSLAMDPIYHEPAISFYVCSTRSGANQSGCQPEYDELRVAQRVGGNWQGHMETVDLEGGYNTRLAFLADGRKVVVYRDMKNGALKLAVRKAP